MIQPRWLLGFSKVASTNFCKLSEVKAALLQVAATLNKALPHRIKKLNLLRLLILKVYVCKKIVSRQGVSDKNLQRIALLDNFTIFFKSFAKILRLNVDYTRNSEVCHL